jgi:cytochrome c peroxidase
MNVPAIINRAWGASVFWDGRAASLEQQALEPVVNPRELASSPDAVVALVRSNRYRADFCATFGAEPGLGQARALASYVRTIVSGDAPYDRYMAGDRAAFDAASRSSLERPPAAPVTPGPRSPTSSFTTPASRGERAR